MIRSFDAYVSARSTRVVVGHVFLFFVVVGIFTMAQSVLFIGRAPETGAEEYRRGINNKHIKSYRKQATAIYTS